MCMKRVRDLYFNILKNCNGLLNWPALVATMGCSLIGWPLMMTYKGVSIGYHILDRKSLRLC